MMIIGNLLKSLTRRQLHTIISRETIKPSSPTPSHLRTYNLSDLDLLNPKNNIPLIIFYQQNADCSLTPDQKSTILKKSLSQSLTRHYPFAGRLSTASYVDCNDEGVVFVDAVNDGRLEDFRRMTGEDEPLGQLFADGVVHSMPKYGSDVVRVQFNRFECGGVGVGVTMSHLIGDACSLGSFLSHWACVARYGSVDHPQVLVLDPRFVNYPRSDSNQPEPRAGGRDVVRSVPLARRLVFPNARLSELMNMIMLEAGGSVNTPTRVEVLTSLLYKTAVTAAATKAGCFRPSYLFFMVNMRNKFVEKLSQTTIGNFVSLVMVPTRHISEASLSNVVAEIKKQKLQFEGVHSLQQLVEGSKLLKVKVQNKELENVSEGSYFCSSFCGFPFSELDFGWGKPMGVTLATRSGGKSGFVLMDTPDGDGIEALVTLEEEQMEIFENDKEILSFCRSN